MFHAEGSGKKSDAGHPLAKPGCRTITGLVKYVQ